MTADEALEMTNGARKEMLLNWIRKAAKNGEACAWVQEYFRPDEIEWLLSLGYRVENYRDYRGLSRHGA